MTAITTPFGFSSTAADVVDGIDLTGRRAVVTGAPSGIGAETARALAATGAEVTLAVRDLAAGERVAKDIAATTGNQLHILVNNAGVMACPEQYTVQGREWQFATNHLGHFALATGLHGALAADGSARVVVVSSTGHQRSPVVWDDIDFAFRPYDPWLAYGQSKTANALMLGTIYSNLQRHTCGRGSGQVPAELIKTVKTGTVDRRSGTLHGVARYAVHPDNARRLWTLSEELLAEAV
ncbi:SDR family NAD(P)-dependent oxidoreductase [Streptomyces sp. NPDC050508]|uniref:SDR family NAD(P)-dependent oxidoreductase n=1 Tax=Streptomyces sp. NPDC050508 TaxID=3155405 RepID=UPI00341367FC